jgi:hypothetical protein
MTQSLFFYSTHLTLESAKNAEGMKEHRQEVKYSIYFRLANDTFSLRKRYI